MVHNMSDSRRKRRKSSKKFSFRGSYSASSEELANINNSNISNKVQIREQTEVHSVTQLQQVSPPPPPPRSLLPDGLEEGIYRLLDAEMVYHPRTDCLLNNTVCGDDKVNAGLRDEAMFSLRFLHKLHNLAPECFAHAVNITDRFLARVKVKAKYMSCLATAAYLIAARMIEEPENQPSPEKLVRIARCGGSPTDLERMAAIIRVKLRPTAACDPAGIEKPQQLQQEAGRLENAVTPLHFLSLLAPLFNSREQFLRAVGDLETALCSVTVYSCRPALLALCVARRHLLAADAVGAAHSSSMLAVLDAAAQLMQLSQADLASCDALIARETQRVCSRRGRRSPPQRQLLTACTWSAAHSLRAKIQKLQKQRQPQKQQQQQQHQVTCLPDSLGCPALGTICEERPGRADEDDSDQVQGLLDIYQLFTA